MKWEGKTMKEEHDLNERPKQFALRIIRLFGSLPKQRDIRRALIEADLVARVTPTLKSLRRKVLEPCLPLVQENLTELCEK